MTMPCRSLATALVAAVLGAQDPTPHSGGDAMIWSGTEGQVYAEMLRLFAGKAAGRPLQTPPGGLQLGGYRLLLFAADQNGIAEPTQQVPESGGYALLAWPIDRSDEARRAVLVHHDGLAMFTDLPADDLCQPSADSLVGKGTDGRFADAMRAPGTSKSGHLWLWMTQAGRPLKVEVVDDNGAPRSRCEVVLRPATGEGQLPPVLLPEGTWPVGRAAVKGDGTATVQGPRCNHMAVEIVVAEGSLLVRSGFQVAANAAGLRIQLTATAIRRTRTLQNEFAAVATLKNIASAEAQCQASSVIDADNDGTGEYGYFAELSGAMSVRGADRKIQPPVLSRAFAQPKLGRVHRAGYVFAIFLCDKDGVPLAELALGGAQEGVDADKTESFWCAYAWPESAETGVRAFFVNQAGDVLATANEDAAYAGDDKVPPPTAAFLPGDPVITNAVAANATGQDGRKWVLVP